MNSNRLRILRISFALVAIGAPHGHTADAAGTATGSTAGTLGLVSTAIPSPSPRQARPKRTLADGRTLIANELKVTLTETAARRLSLDAAGNPQPVDSADLLTLHSAIVAVEGRHLCSRSWLKGEPLPEHLRRTDGLIPRIARNFSAILVAGADVVEVRAELRRHPDVERVDFNEVLNPHSIPNDPLYTNQWAPAITGLETAWDVPGQGRIRVAVIDTGVQLSHPEFAGRIVFQEGYADFDSGEAPASGDRFDHGTHVAGIIAAERNNWLGVAGYSNDIDLMVLNCATWDSDENEWRISDSDDAMDDAVANGAHIINCSFAFSDSIEDEVEAAYDASVLVVHAAGNDSWRLHEHWESRSIALFTVTATMLSGSPATDVFDTNYSNFGPGMDIAAPGTAIYSTVPGNGYGYMQGTSMAAPQVSGAAALLMSMNPLRIGDESARHLLIRMAEDKGAPGYDEEYGWGVLRLRRSTLQACRNATAFVSSASLNPEGGNYDWPWRSITAALDNVPDGATLILNGGVFDVPVYTYPAITITKPCTLSAIPDRPVLIGD
jgi:subtilisin family serine protease